MSTAQPRVTAIVLPGGPPSASSEEVGGGGASVRCSDYPRELLDIVVVGAPPPSRRRIRRRPPLTTSAAAANVAARNASTPLLAFVQPRVMLEPHCVDALVVALMGADGAVAAGAALVVDDAEALAAAQGLGPRRPNLAAWPTDDGSVDAPTPTLVLGSAVHLVDRTAFLEAGGYTELLAAPEALGLDLAWRLRLAGHTAIHVPAARARCTVSPPPQARLRELRDLLATLMLDLGDETLDRLLPTLLVGTAAGVLERTAQTAALDLRSFDIDADAGGGGYPIPATGSDAAELVALRDVALRLPQLMDKREQVQARRRRPDDEILAELRPYRRPAPWSTRTMTTVAETMGAAKLFAVAPRRVLVFSPEVLPYPELPTVGSGLRAWGIGQGLALCGHEVVYSMPHAALAGLRERVPPEASAVAWREGAMWAVVERVLPDVIVVCGWGVADHLTQDELAQVPLLIDQHGPHLLERDFQQTGSRDENYRAKVEAFARADYFTCAGSRQLPYFEPILADAGWDEGERRTRVAAVPFSLAPELPPREPNDGLHFVYGGVWLPWQDPTTGLQTLVEELDRRDLGTLHLFGGKHPWLNLDTGVYEPLIRRIENSPHVVLEGTLSRDELIDRYRRASVAFDLMRRNPERELAFTSRTVEYLWCGLPVVYNDYAELAELIAEYDAGWTVPADEPDTIRAVVDQIFADPELVERKGENARRLARERLTWDRTIEPLDRFVRTAGIRRNAVRPTRRLVEPPKPSLPAQVYWVWRHHGIRAVIAKSQARLRQRQPAEAEPERDR